MTCRHRARHHDDDAYSACNGEKSKVVLELHDGCHLSFYRDGGRVRSCLVPIRWALGLGALTMTPRSAMTMEVRGETAIEQKKYSYKICPRSSLLYYLIADKYVIVLFLHRIEIKRLSMKMKDTMSAKVDVQGMRSLFGD